MVTWGRVIPPEDAIVGSNERVIEIPLALEVMQLDKPGWVLDAGCALNGSMPDNPTADTLHVTQNIESEKVHATRHRGYVSADLRHLTHLFAQDAFDRTVCVSTLEHVGLDNACYGAETEDCPQTTRQAVQSLGYVTARTLLLTMPWAADGKVFPKWRYLSAGDVTETIRTLKDFGFTVEARYYARHNKGWYGGDTIPAEANPYMENEQVNAIVAIKGVRA